MLKQILQGMVVGIANIIPGVSGGTMMVAMGLYDHLIHAITHLKSEFKKSMKLLIPIFLGAGIAIVVLSRLFEYLLEVYPIPTNFASVSYTHLIIKNQSVKKKLENNETLSEKELMLLIILPLAKKGKEVKQKVIEQVVDLAKQIEDENTQAFVILVFW